jgi:ribulose-phosphate 3-epimerase
MYNLIMQKVKISASILNADFGDLKNQIKALEAAGVDQIHLDIMDGHFVPNISVGPFIIQTCRRITSLPLDTHLMVDNPDQYIDDCVSYRSGGISVHIEGNPNIHRTLQRIKDQKVRAGIVLNPGTPVESIYSVIDMVDLILIMTVNPGFGGQSFINSQLAKIAAVKKMVDGKNIIIEVDGGINSQTLPLAYQAGANLFVIGSAIFSHPGGINQAVLELVSSIK